MIGQPGVNLIETEQGPALFSEGLVTRYSAEVHIAAQGGHGDLAVKVFKETLIADDGGLFCIVGTHGETNIAWW